MKPCSSCKVTKPLTDFYKDKSTNDGYECQCISCRKDARSKNRDVILQRKRAYNKKHKERINKNNKLFRDNNKEYLIQWQTNRMATYRPQHLLNATKRSAHLKNLEHTLTLNDIIIPTKCPYLNVELTHEMGKGQVQSNSSIDRIDNSKGYTSDNIQIISKLANTMKNNATIEQLITFAKNILALHSGIKSVPPLKQLDIQWAQRMCVTSKKTAKKYNIPYTILPTDIKVADKCIYLDVPLTYTHGKGVVQSNVSIDRIIPSKGYTPDNIQVISRFANLMKNKATKEQLITFSKSILKLHI